MFDFSGISLHGGSSLDVHGFTSMKARVDEGMTLMLPGSMCLATGMQ